MSDLSILNKFIELADSNRNISEISDINQRKFLTGDLSDYVTIRPRVKGNQQIAIATPPEFLTQKLGSVRTYTDATEIPTVSQRWSPEAQGINKRFTPRQLLDTFEIWEFGEAGNLLADEGARVIQFIADYTVDGARQDTKRILYHAGEALTGGTTAAKNTEATNVLSDAAQVPRYNQFSRGIVETFKHWYKTSSYGLSNNFVEFTKNNNNIAYGTNSNQQYGVTGEEVLELLQDLVKDGNKGITGDTIYLSETLYDAYMEYKETRVLESSIRAQERGAVPVFRRKPIVKIQVYDNYRTRFFRRTYPGSLNHVDVPHFALYCRKADLLLGVDSAESLTNIRIERPGGSDDNFYIKGEYLIDFKFAAPIDGGFKCISLGAK